MRRFHFASISVFMSVTAPGVSGAVEIVQVTPSVGQTVGAASGDTNADGSVDLTDYVDFEACLLGPDGGLGTGCECFDFDSDNDADLLDVATFQVNFTGD